MATPPPTRRWTAPATALLCLLWLAAFLLGGSRVTRGFERWTFEDVRRDDARQQGLRAPPTLMETASGDALWAFPDVGAGTGAGQDTVYLVDFVYTRCETVCRVLGVEFFQMQEQLRRSQARVQLLSISIDPARDLPAALADYGRSHRADARLWTLARPASAEGLARLRQALGVIVIPDGLGGFVHNGAIHVFDARHRLRAIYDHADWIGALAFAEALAGSQAP